MTNIARLAPSRSIAMALAASVGLAAHAAQAEATPEMFGALPNVSEVEISPDGKTLAVLQQAGGAAGVLLFDAENLKTPPKGIGLGKSIGRGLQWADDTHLLLLASQDFDKKTSSGPENIQFWRWMSINRDTLKTKMIFNNESGVYIGSAGSFESLLPTEPGKAVFSRFTTRRGYGYSLFKVNLDSGGTETYVGGEPETSQWVVDETGEPAIRVDYDAVKKQRKIYGKKGSNRFELLNTFDEAAEDDAVIWIHGLAPAGGLVGEAYNGTDKRALYQIDLASGAIGAPVYSNPDYDTAGANYDPRSARATAVYYIDDFLRAAHLDSADQKVQVSLGKALPNAAPLIVSQTTDKMKMIVRASYANHPDQFFLFDRAKKSLDMVAASYTALDGKDFGRKEKFDYTAADGVAIRGYLTVPAGAPSSNMPLIVLPHGGPEGRDDMSFDWWSFFYAARGYLVYQPNFRGSDGYGMKFRSAGYGEWGRKMQDDITEGVKKLIAGGRVDPNRVCIVGASYGGYAALAGATLTPDLYKCSVSVAGVSDLMGMLGRSKIEGGEYALDYWEKRIGNRFRDAKALNDVSPAKIAAQAGPPVLLVHGVDDTVVPIGQSRMMRDALKSAGKPVEYVELAGEDHWLSTGATRTEMLRASIQFIDRHIGAK